MQGTWFSDRSILQQELVEVEENGERQDGVSLLVTTADGNAVEILLTRDELLKCLSEMEC